jgi:hypothetical protein
MRIVNSAGYYCIKYLFFVSGINLIENQKRKPSSHCSGTYRYGVILQYGHPFDHLLEFVGVHTERPIPRRP